MLEIIEKEDHSRRNLPEDVFFARACNVKLYMPTGDEASKFSIENYLGCGNSFGCHKPWPYQMNYCTSHEEIMILMKLQ